MARLWRLLGELRQGPRGSSTTRLRGSRCITHMRAGHLRLVRFWRPPSSKGRGSASSPQLPQHRRSPTATCFPTCPHLSGFSVIGGVRAGARESPPARFPRRMVPSYAAARWSRAGAIIAPAGRLFLMFGQEDVTTAAAMPQGFF